MLKAKLSRRTSEFHEKALSEVKKTELHRMNVDIPVETFRRLKSKVALDGRFKSISDAVKLWIAEYVKEG